MYLYNQLSVSISCYCGYFAINFAFNVSPDINLLREFKLCERNRGCEGQM